MTFKDLQRQISWFSNKPDLRQNCNSYQSTDDKVLCFTRKENTVYSS